MTMHGPFYALCYSFAFCVPGWWLLIVCAHAFLYHSIQDFHNTHVVWFFIGMCGQLFPFVQSMSLFSYGSYIFGVIIAAWCAVHFFIVMRSYCFFKMMIDSPWLHRVLWACCMTLFTYWLVNCCFWPLGYCEGYWCFHPFVVLIQNQALVFFSTLCGLWSATFYYFVFCACLGAFLYDAQLWKWIVVMAMPFFLGIVGKNNDKECPLYVHKYIALQTYFRTSQDPYVWTRQVQQRIRFLQDTHPGQVCFLAPESWFPYVISDKPVLCDAIVDALAPSSLFIAGGYFKNNDRYYNALYAFCHDAWNVILVKRHGVFFIERIPWIFSWLFDAHLFCQGAAVFNKEYIINMQGGEYYALCSDFHMMNSFEKKGDAVWIVLVNDGWFKATTIPLLLRNAAFLRSWLSGISLFYISYDYAEFFQHGFSWPLQKSMII